MPRSYEQLKKESKAAGERLDCTVKAVAIAAYLPYTYAAALLEKFGRKYRDGFSVAGVKKAMGFIDRPLVRVTDQFDAKTFRTLERQLPKRGIFIITSSSHMACARAGTIIDWTSGRLHRIEHVYRVTRRKPNDDN